MEEVQAAVEEASTAQQRHNEFHACKLDSPAAPGVLLCAQMFLAYKTCIYDHKSAHTLFLNLPLRKPAQ